MTLFQFKLLNEDDQASTIWLEGVLLDFRCEGSCKILLYQLHRFYVEVFYNYKSNKIERFKSFISVDGLHPYLQKIDVSKAFK